MQTRNIEEVRFGNPWSSLGGGGGGCDGDGGCGNGGEGVGCGH